MIWSIEYFPGPTIIKNKKHKEYIKGISLIISESCTCNIKYPVNVTAKMGRVASLVKNPRIMKIGNPILATIANVWFRFSGIPNGFGTDSGVDKPIPIFLKPCTTISSKETIIRNMHSATCTMELLK
tara:strand:+ start:10979 stop:11359 length:381 start_codon:yes stop_codon:yes gene_type:complete